MTQGHGKASVQLQVFDRQQVEHQVSATVGEPLMFPLRDAQLDIDATCGGSCICATCHILLMGDWPAELRQPGADETLMLEELVHAGPDSRLACQVQVREDMDGCRLQVAPEEV